MEKVAMFGCWKMSSFGESTCISEIDAFRIDLSGVFWFYYYETTLRLKYFEDGSQSGFLEFEIERATTFFKEISQLSILRFFGTKIFLLE